MKVQAECNSCRGTGVYVGFAEARGTAVVCINCDGTGERTIEYTPFTGLKKREGVHTVSRSRGSFIATGVGAYGSSISYDDFLKGKRP